MTKVTLNNVGSLIEATTAATTINNNFGTIQTAFDNTLSRDGTSPNQMGSSLDMNSHNLINLPVATTSGEPVTFEVFEAAVLGAGNVPAGGTTGQVLAKASNADYATAWTSESAELTAGTNITITGSSPVTVSTVASPTFTAPVLGTPASATLTNATGLPVSTGISGLGAGVATFLTTPTSANLASAVTNETGSGALVFGTSPTISAPTISGHPTIEGVTSTGATGTGNLVFATNPTISGNITSTTFNNVGLSSAGATAALGLGSGKNVQLNNSMTLAGTDGTTITFQATDTYVGRTTSDTLTNKTIPAASNTLSGTAASLTAGNVTTNANLTGDVTSSGNATTLTNAPVIAKVLTGYTSGAGTVSATDSILQAIQKLNGNDATNANLTGDITSVGNATTFTGKTGGALGQIPGTATNDSASTGNVGEYRSNNLATPTSLVSNTAKIITTLTALPAGDWDVWGTMYFIPAATTTTSIAEACINTSTAITNTPGTYTVEYFGGSGAIGGSFAGGVAINTPVTRVSLSTATDVSLIALVQFSVSTMTAFGGIQARRRR